TNLDLGAAHYYAVVVHYWYMQLVKYDGNIHVLASVYRYSWDGDVVRMVLANGQVGAYVNDSLVMAVPSDWSNGYAGVGACYSITGGLMSSASFGVPDSAAPTAIPVGSIGISPYSNHVDLQWPA